MAALFRRRPGDARFDAATLDRLTRHHLLLVPAGGPTLGDVAALVRSRVDDADLDVTGTAKVGRRSSISGPFELGPADARGAQGPGGPDHGVPAGGAGRA